MVKHKSLLVVLLLIANELFAAALFLVVYRPLLNLARPSLPPAIYRLFP